MPDSCFADGEVGVHVSSGCQRFAVETRRSAFRPAEEEALVIGAVPTARPRRFRETSGRKAGRRRLPKKGWLCVSGALTVAPESAQGLPRRVVGEAGTESTVGRARPPR